MGTICLCNARKIDQTQDGPDRKTSELLVIRKRNMELPLLTVAARWPLELRLAPLLISQLCILPPEKIIMQVLV